MRVITPVAPLSDCCEAYTRPAMCFPPTMLPVIESSKDGVVFASDGAASSSGHVTDAAGI